MGNGYLGTTKLEISTTANHEVIPNSPESWTIGYSLYKLSFWNQQECTVIINDSTEIFLMAEQGFNVEKGDLPITSFKVKQQGINYLFVGAY